MLLPLPCALVPAGCFNMQKGYLACMLLWHCLKKLQLRHMPIAAPCWWWVCTKHMTRHVRVCFATIRHNNHAVQAELMHSKATRSGSFQTHHPAPSAELVGLCWTVQVANGT